VIPVTRRHRSTPGAQRGRDRCTLDSSPRSAPRHRRATSRRKNS